MAEPWLAIIGLGEDGLAGLGEASRAALDGAEIVFGGARHLDLAQAGARGRAWPVPFDLAPVLAERGRRVAVLASGDPFWFGVGGSLAAAVSPEQWLAFPAASTFSLAAARLGWRLEEVLCLGLHAAPAARLRPHLARGQRIICLLRDGAAAAGLARYLVSLGFGESVLHGLEALGGAHERRWKSVAQGFDRAELSGLLAVAVEVRGGLGLPRSAGLPDEVFDHDGQITKRPLRALTLSALAPRAGEVLWDIGSGSGSVAIEFLLAATGSLAHAVEADPARAARAKGNAEALGVGHRYRVSVATAPEGLPDWPKPDAVFIGGGASEALLASLWPRIAGARLVANAVTLETEALLMQWQAAKGGSLLRIDLAEAQPLGRRRGWVAARPVVQWSVTA